MKSKIRIEESIRPWLLLGPFFSETMENISEEDKKILISKHYEGEPFESSHGKAYWSLLRKEEKYIAFGRDYEKCLLWGKGHIPSRYVSLFLNNEIVSEKEGITTFRLTTFADIRITIAINGDVVYDKESFRNDNLFFEDYFKANLARGENMVNIRLSTDIFRRGHPGIMVEPLDNVLDVIIPNNPNISVTTREKIEKELNSLRLEKDLFYPGDKINLISDIRVSCEVILATDKGETVVERKLSNEKKIILYDCKELEDGSYKILCIWEDENKNYVTSTSFNIIKLTPTETLKGIENLENRKTHMLEYFATHPVPGRDEIWSQVARYHLNLPIDEEVVRRACQHIKMRRDCSDFIIQAILRLIYWEKDNQKLSSEIKDFMKETILGFRYWVDEPGERTMYMDTENHRFLFHTAEWLAGLLFPTEKFTNSQQRGLYHTLKGRMYLSEWLKERIRFGFDEWHSNSYYPVVFVGLTNLYDFAPQEEYKLKMMAKNVLDYMFFILAQDTFHGVFGTTHGRGYSMRIKHPDRDESSSLCWLLYGEGNLRSGEMAGVSVASSKYSIPEIILEIAHDWSTTVESHERQGIISYRGLSANLVVYKTPDYMISALQDFQKGEYIHLIKGAEILKPGVAMYWSFPYTQIHVAQITLKNKNVIFWSCPLTSEEGLQPDYWGNITLPRAIQYKNVVALLWKQNRFSWMTHCFFETSRFDEYYIDGNWAFARVEDGYLGIYSQNGFSMRNKGQYAGRELICYAEENIWLAECGRKKDWDSFNNFIDNIKRTEIKSTEEELTYNSPSIGKFTVGWEIEPTLNGERIKIKDYPLLDSPFGYSSFGSGRISLRFEDKTIEIFS